MLLLYTCACLIDYFPPQIFDPLGLSDGAAPGDIKKWREAEIKHGRVAMLASLGVLVAEVRYTASLASYSSSRLTPRIIYIGRRLSWPASPVRSVMCVYRTRRLVRCKSMGEVEPSSHAHLGYFDGVD